MLSYARLLASAAAVRTRPGPSNSVNPPPKQAAIAIHVRWARRPLRWLASWVSVTRAPSAPRIASVFGPSLRAWPAGRPEEVSRALGDPRVATALARPVTPPLLGLRLGRWGVSCPLPCCYGNRRE